MSKGPSPSLGRQRTLVALVLLVSSNLAFAADGASLALFHGPNETGSMDLKGLRIALDGKDLQLPAPATGGDPDVAVFTGPVAPGAHKLEVEAALESGESVFTYMEGYKVTLRSQLDIEVLPGEGVAIRSRIVPREGVGLPWQEQNKLLVTLTARDGAPERSTEVAVAPSSEPASAPSTTLAPAAEPVAEPAGAASEPAPVAAEPSVEPVAEPVAAAREPEPLAAEPVAPAREPAPVLAARQPEPVAAAREPEAAPAEPVAQPARRETIRAPARPAREAATPAPEPAARPAAPATRVAKAEAAATSPASGDCALDPIRFAFDSAELPAEALEPLDRFAACVSATGRAVRVEGHTDARGTDEYNRWLGWDRAAAVSAYLRGRGLPERRVSTHFLGKSRPLCDEPTEACHAQNRRVEAAARE